MRPRAWRLLRSEPAFEHRWYRVRRDVVELPDGRVLDDYLVSVRPEIAVVVPLTAAGEVVLVHQWKQGIREFMLEIPGGLVDDGESPEEAARRELVEETGYAAPAPLEPLGVWELDPTKSSNRAHAFLARDVVRVGEPRPDPQEEIELVLLPLADAVAAVADGRISAVTSAAALLRTAALADGGE
jgi:8-oxo-dGTP pyrophosphatase MutT (NUDIX family)